MSVGIKRSIDPLGRISIPIEYRREMGVKEGERMEIFCTKSGILIKKAHPRCVFCQGTADRDLFDKPICSKCLEKLRRCL